MVCSWKQRGADIVWHEKVQVFAGWDTDAKGDGDSFLGQEPSTASFQLQHCAGMYQKMSMVLPVINLRTGSLGENGTRHFSATTAGVQLRGIAQLDLRNAESESHEGTER
ncbi:uncharacterized protein B0T15DRAFT_508365 [Chaetomium strumarium]|uniref:Uncharacterized protein n=1 Tax=Chaetomium strumarium TaxID=1170767 RepID=A0AAJ0M3X2_9PEZI|nr:hypothetical protein B0T15DRAFT_508365 [Chaetomium strumarium]